eukprot:6556482-Alexandrium_andersonii.AAC.1
MRSKLVNDVNQAITKLISFYNSYKHTVTIIQSDSENVLKASATYAGMKHMVRMRHTPPYQHAQRIERYVRTIKEHG